eukprot:7254690-Pyramimonas_sp.AAC.1
MDGRLLVEMLLVALAPRIFVLNVATELRLEGGTFSKWGFRLSAARIRLKGSQQLHGLEGDSVSTCCSAHAPREHVRQL